jgi:hypothetical protein
MKNCLATLSTYRSIDVRSITTLSWRREPGVEESALSTAIRNEAPPLSSAVEISHC